MSRLFSLRHSLELAAAVVTVAGIGGVLQTFVIGKHYVIPTMLLMLTVFAGNLARAGWRGQAWAKHTLFWLFFVFTFHLFAALFFAATPRDILGAAFPWVYGALFLLFAFLVPQYARANALFRN